MRPSVAAALAVIGLGWAGGAWAQLAATTVEGYVACLTEEWLDDIVSFSVAKDHGSIQAYLDQDKCVVLRGGLRVTITDAGFTKHEFSYMGLKLYTVREGLKRVR